MRATTVSFLDGSHDTGSGTGGGNVIYYEHGFNSEPSLGQHTTCACGAANPCPAHYGQVAPRLESVYAFLAGLAAATDSGETPE